jgi:hypothetical protein
LRFQLPLLLRYSSLQSFLLGRYTAHRDAPCLVSYELLLQVVLLLYPPRNPSIHQAAMYG